jgi:hypothetical protein
MEVIIVCMQHALLSSTLKSHLVYQVINMSYLTLLRKLIQVTFAECRFKYEMYNAVLVSFRAQSCYIFYSLYSARNNVAYIDLS